MKNWQFIILILLISLWFWILFYQNNKILSYWKALDWRQVDIYKNTMNTNTMATNIEEIRDRTRWLWRMVSEYTRLDIQENWNTQDEN